MKISNADLKRSKELLTLDVTVIAPTLGWTNVALSKVEYVKPPEDGLQDIILSATAPTGPTGDSIEIFSPSVSFGIPVWFQGVRISNRAGNETRVLRSPVVKQSPIGNSSFFIDPARIDIDKLLLDVRYGGGCKKHNFQLNWDGDIIKTFPPQVNFDLTHNSHGDNCMALLSETLQFDLSVLENFPSETVDINILAPGGTIKVRYTPSNAHFELAAKASAMPLPVVKRGYSNNFDFAEAMRNAMAQIPDRGGDIPDFLAHYSVKQIGAEVGGIAGLNRLFVDVEG